MDINSILKERGDVYGKFKDGAAIMQHLKSVMHQQDGWARLTDSQREALEMIQHKIGRILNGEPSYVDNFADIAGYATLVRNEMINTDGAKNAKVTNTKRVDGTWIDIN